MKTAVTPAQPQLVDKPIIIQFILYVFKTIGAEITLTFSLTDLEGGPSAKQNLNVRYLGVEVPRSTEMRSSVNRFPHYVVL